MAKKKASTKSKSKKKPVASEAPQVVSEPVATDVGPSPGLDRAESEPAIEPAAIEPSTEPATPRQTGWNYRPVSKLLDDVMADAPPPDAPEAEFDAVAATKRRRYPLFLDILLGCGLLVAVGGFTIGLFKMYLTHSAKQYMADSNYTAAISLLRRNPLPPFFNVDGTDPRDLLDQCLYSDAMRRIADEGDVNGAVAELEQIRPGSSYFDNAQQILSENFVPSTTVLTGGVEEERSGK